VPETRPATAQELKRWNRDKRWLEVISMQNSANQHRKSQIDIGLEFCYANEIEIFINEQIPVMLERDARSQTNLGRLINDVENGVLGLSFPNGVSDRLDIMGPLDLNQDEIQSYQFGVLVIIGGVLIITGLTLKVIELYERLEVTEGNEETALNFIQEKIAEKPDLEQQWEQTKQNKGWNQKQTYIDALENSIDKLVNYLKKPISTGISWGIPIAAGILLIYFLRRNK